MTRRFPRWSELKPFIGGKRTGVRPRGGRLEDALIIEDLRSMSRRRSPRAVFDYVDGAAESEISLERSRALFAALQFNPSVLQDVSAVDASVQTLGRTAAEPFAFAPTGFTRLMHHEGEAAVVRVAERRGIPYALSTMGTTSIEDVAAAGPGARKWFQLYVWKDRAAALDLISRAKSAGFEALILTVDVPVAGARLRDVRNGFSIPPTLGVKTVANMAMHPAWWFNLVSTEPLNFASLHRWNGTVAEIVNSLFDPSVTFADLDWLRSVWDGPLVVKGIQTVEDARRVGDIGAEAIVLSNHGGRQLDRAPIPLRLVPDAVDAVGDRTEIWLDSGVLHGGDIVAAHALGAKLVLVGRAYLYGLMAAGEHGVDRAAEILGSEVRRTMQLLGVRTVSELGARHVTLP